MFSTCSSESEVPSLVPTEGGFSNPTGKGVSSTARDRGGPTSFLLVIPDRRWRRDINPSLESTVICRSRGRQS